MREARSKEADGGRRRPGLAAPEDPGGGAAGGLEPRRLLRLLLVPVALLAVAALAGGLYVWRMGEPEGTFGRNLLRLADLDAETGVGTWLATLLHAGSAAAAGLAAWATRRRGGAGAAGAAAGWGGLAVVFAGLSLDEAAMLHEMLVEPARGVVGRLDATLHPGLDIKLWVLPGFALVAVFTLGFLRFFQSLPRRTRAWVGVGLGLLVGGALGVEVLNGVALARWGPGPVSGGLVVVEEVLELLGAAVVLSGVAGHASARLRVWVEARAPLASPPGWVRDPPLPAGAVGRTVLRTQEYPMARLVAVPADGPALDSPSSPKPARAPYLVLYDLESDAWEAHENPGASAPRHPGIRMARFLVDRGVTDLVGHHMGQHPVILLSQADVTVHEGLAGASVTEVVARVREGALPALTPQEVVSRRMREGC